MYQSHLFERYCLLILCFCSNEGMRRLAEEFEVGEPTMQLIIDGLQQPVDRDIREGEFIYTSIFSHFYPANTSLAQSRRTCRT